MSLERHRGARRAGSIAAILIAVGIAIAVAASVRPVPERHGEPVARPTERPTPAVPRYELRVDVGQVLARRVAKRPRPAKLRAAVRGVRETITRLYSIGFVDPRAWRDGEFPALETAFAPRARSDVRRDVDDLTLGERATRLSYVRPDHARLGVRLLVGASRRPVAAVAEMEFAGTAFRGSAKRGLVRHRARYVLRPARRGWLVQAYKLRRARPAGNVALRGDRQLFVLAIGSDARPGQAVARARADSLHIVGINRRRGVASVLGIPRDSFVTIPGHGTDKINAALSLGGPELQVRTVERLTGVAIDGYLLTGFEGFKRAVSALGGVNVRIPYAMSDPESRARFRPGPARLDGPRALAFSRNRHDAPGGDFGRSLNQGRLIVAAFRKLREEIASDPASLFRWIAASYRHVETDLTIDEMLELLLGALTVERRVENRVVSGSGGTAGSKSIVRLGTSARRTFADLRRDAVLGRR